MAPSLKVVAAVLLLAGGAVVMGTGAFTAVSSERTASVRVVGDSSALLRLEPHGSDSGATLVDGQLQIGELNIDATTDYGDGVFSITNQGTQPVGVWIVDRDENGVNHTDKATFYNDTFGGGAGTTARACENGVKSIEDKPNAVQLDVGETLVVDLKIVTDGVASANADVLTGMAVHASAEVAGTSAPTTDVACAGTGDGGSGGAGSGVDLVRDTDGDTMDDDTEEAIGTDPTSADTDGDGIPDDVETTRSNGDGPGYEVDTDGDGRIDANDTDADGDGIADSVEGTDDADDDGIANYRDLDSDGDGQADGVEGTGDDDGDGVPNYLDAEQNSLDITIEVKPEEDDEPDPINPDTPGTVPVAVITAGGFDATTLNDSSLRFGTPDTIDTGGGASPAHAGGHPEDVDEDGDTDLVVHFPKPGTGFTDGDTEAKLVGETADGTAVAGNESITTVGGGEDGDNGENGD